MDYISFWSKMKWLLILIVLTNSKLVVECRPILPCQLEDELTIPELSLPHELRQREIKDGELEKLRVENQLQPCDQGLSKCSELKPQLSDKVIDGYNKLIAGIGKIYPTPPKQVPKDESPVNCPYSEYSSRIVSRESLDRQNEKERRNRMFEGLLRLTTFMNKVDSFLTEKAKIFIRGLNKMVESEESESFR